MSYSRLMQSHQRFATLILLSMCAAYSEMTVTVCVAKPKQQSSENIAALKMQCEQKNYASCFSLGTKYMSGIEVPKDMVLAAKLYQGACDHGYAKACSALGFFYKVGLGVSQDTDRAVVLCRRGCEGGDGVGCAVLASMYEVPPSHARWKSLTALSSARNSVENHHLLRLRLPFLVRAFCGYIEP